MFSFVKCSCDTFNLLTSYVSSMRKKRPIFKGHSFSIRVPEKVRYGLDLLCRKHNVQISSLVLRAIEQMFEVEGLSKREPGQLLSLLDRLWSESEIERLEALQAHAPELATSKERVQIQFLKLVAEVDSVEDFKSRFFSFGGPVDVINDLTDDTISALTRAHAWLRDVAATPSKFREWLEIEQRAAYAAHQDG